MNTIEIEQDQEISPKRILRIGTSFWSAKPLITAVRLGLFTELADGPLFTSEIRHKLGLDHRSNLEFLDTLVSFGLIERQGKGFTAIYRNSAESDTFLNRRKPNYIGNVLEMLADGRMQTGVKETGYPSLLPHEIRVSRPAAAMAYH